MKTVRVALLLVSCGIACPAAGGDWPTWRHDAARTAVCDEPLPEHLHPCWVRQYPAPQPAFGQVRQGRQQFDLGYEPVVAGKTMVVGSSVSDRVTALDTETGDERWRFYAEGPVRLAPALWHGRVYFASDDGRLYCLDAADGRLVWSRRAAPSARKVIGNGQLVSVWPARGGPVVADGVVYFAAGVWPFEGIFVNAFDAETGRVIWINDRTGSLYIEHPHGAMSFGGPSPQGYLMIQDGQLVVPSSRAFPAFFDRATGKLQEFAFGHGGHGSRPGGWFVASDNQGELIVDSQIDTETHDVGVQVIGQTGVKRAPDEVLETEITVGDKTYQIREGERNTIRVAGRELTTSNLPVAVEETVHTMLAADGKLFVVSREGAIYCFGPEEVAPVRHAVETKPLDRPDDVWPDRVRKILDRAGSRRGYAVVCGLGDGRLPEELALRSELNLIVVDPDAAKIDAFRRRLDDAGLYGRRVAALVGRFGDFEWPPYLADLIVAVDPLPAGLDSDTAVEAAFRCLRPYGGAIVLGQGWRDDCETRECGADAGTIALSADAGNGPGLILVRRGPPPGAADYTGTANGDELVRAPLGLLWFGDTFHHHKLFYKTFYHETGRGLPQTIAVVGGVMHYLATSDPYGPNPKGVSYANYLRALERDKEYFDAYTDVYTGRVLSPKEVEAGAFPPPAEPETTPPSNVPASPAVRRNPLTGVCEGRGYLKTYGCDRSAVDYGKLLTMRSGTAAFYDKGLESGTINVSGIRSGCRNSIVPGCGVLALPSWTGNCTCNYPVFTSLALVHMPESFEQWSAWGDVAVEAPIERVGLNFGAPGDRVADDGTLWLDCPSVGGPSPRVPVSFTPDEPRWFYRHALWMDRRETMPWLTASGAEGVRSIRIVPVALKSGPPSGGFSVRWNGSVEPPASATYNFHVRTGHGARLWIDGKLLADNAKDLRRGVRGEVACEVALEAGRRYDLVLECYQPAGVAADREAELAWSSPAMPRCVVPTGCLQAADGRSAGLTGAYFQNESFAGPAVLQNDPVVQFAWGEAGPEPLLRLDDSYAPPDRTYDVAMWFAEPDELGPGQRVFSVRAGGREVIAGLDVAAEAGGPGRSVVRRFTTKSVGGAIEIELVPSTAKPPLVSGILLSAAK